MNASSTALAKAGAQPTGWDGRRIATLTAGVLAGLFALALLGVGGTALWADTVQRDGGYVTSSTHTFSSGGSAIATESTHLGSPGVGWLYSPGVLGKVRIRVTPLGNSAVFVGVGRTTDVDRYLGGVGQTVVSDFFSGKSEVVAGGASRSAPATQRFWAASDTGAGERTLLWSPKHGSWTVVVMNANGHPGLAVKADLGARMPFVIWIAIGLLLAGALCAAGAAFLIVGAARTRRVATS